ncbi:MAG: TIGR00341 family protein [Cypionkella sp.]
MSYQVVQVIVEKTKVDDVIEIAEMDGVWLSGVTAVKGEKRTVQFLATRKARQKLVDALQKGLYRVDDWHIILSPVDAVVAEEQDDDDQSDDVSETREALLNQVTPRARLTPTFLMLVAISAVVAALGMIENNVAAIIGAMVIAPLLGPLLGSILGIALGERDLIAKSLIASVSGIALALAIGVVLGVVLRFEPGTTELASRAKAGFGDIALALAAGAAAALSLTAGAEATLVGVMVAVALIPPATAIGLFLGKGQWSMAGSSAILLAVNLAALHLSGQLVFLVRGVKPRTRHRQAKVKQAVRFSLIVSGVLLAAMALMIGYFYLHHAVVP